MTSKIEETLAALRAYQPPPGWDGHLLLLPEVCVRQICDHIQQYRLGSCLELGTGFGATSCAIAAALQEQGFGTLTTVDIYEHQPVNLRALLEHMPVDPDRIEIITDPLGYNWVMADLLQESRSKPRFDLIFLDGAHEWKIDAFQVRMVFDLLVTGHPEYGHAHEFPVGRMGWARQLRKAGSVMGVVDRLRKMA